MMGSTISCGEKWCLRQYLLTIITPVFSLEIHGVRHDDLIFDGFGNYQEDLESENVDKRGMVGEEKEWYMLLVKGTVSGCAGSRA